MTISSVALLGRVVLVMLWATAPSAALQSSVTMASSYQDASGVAKGIVSGLTAVSTWLRPSRTQTRLYRQQTLTFEEVSRGIREDFRRGYLFSGEIDEEIYAGNCSFTDPTLSFEGLDTFVNNIASIRPLVDIFIDDAIVVLYSLSRVSSSPPSLQASWRMSGGLRLPWKPRIELLGRTTFLLSPSQGGRIVEYYEVWYTEPLQVLSQIFRPARKPPSLPSESTMPVRTTGLRTVSLLIDELKDDLFACVKWKPSDDANLRRLIERLAFAYALGSLPESIALKSCAKSKWRQIFCRRPFISLGGISVPYRGLTQEFDDDVNFRNVVEILPGLRASSTGSVIEKTSTTHGNIASYKVEISDSHGCGSEFWRVVYEDEDFRIFDISGTIHILRRA